MKTERITVEPSRLCRACGAEHLHMFPLSARDPDNGIRLDDMLMACTDLKINVGDGLPSSICYSCADELRTSYQFKQCCETTDRYFNELGLKSNEIKQEQETVVFKEGANENLFELKEEIDTNDKSSSLSFKEVTEGISEPVVILREIKQEQGDFLTITETVVYKQEENFSEVTEDEPIRVGNLEDSPPNEDLCFENFQNKNENRNVVFKKAENEEFPSGSKEEKEEETIDDGTSEASSSSENDDSDCFPKEELRKISRLGRFDRKTTHENGEQNYYKCNLCEKSYSLSCSLQKHKEIHENGGRKRFKCDICEKSFTRNSYLRLHTQRHENGGRKNFECDVCKKSFSTNTYLRVHKQIHENGEQKHFKCEICEKSFSMTRYLRLHKQTHENGEQKRFKCDICEKLFATSTYLWKHKQRHENGGRKSFECDVCEKSFSTSRYLQVHKKTHKKNIFYEKK